MSKGLAKEVVICGRTVRLGDYLKVMYMIDGYRGCCIEGTVTELWSPELDGLLQGRLACGWCFHDYDEIIDHKPGDTGPAGPGAGTMRSQSDERSEPGEPAPGRP